MADPEKTKEQEKKDAENVQAQKLHQENKLIAESKNLDMLRLAQSLNQQSIPTDPTSYNENKQEKNEVKNLAFEIKPKKQIENSNEEDPKIQVGICCNSSGAWVCVPVDMSLGEAKEHCAATNALYNSDDPKDRERAEASWQKLLAGDEQGSKNLLEEPPSGKKMNNFLAQGGLHSLPNTPKKPIDGLEDRIGEKASPNKTEQSRQTPVPNPKEENVEEKLNSSSNVKR